MNDRRSFRGRRVVMTGASSGIGRALAIALAAEGAQLTLAARRQEALDETARACEAAGGRALSMACDLRDEAACQRLIQTAQDEFGGIDVLVNNAGLSMSARFDSVRELSIFRQLMETNYLSSVYCTHFALDALKRSRGLLVAVSSVTGKMGVPYRSGYAASKHAMQGFFDSLRIELQPDGVDVLIVSPGFVATDIRARALGADGAPLGRSPRDERRGTLPLADCVEQMVAAMRDRRRELVLSRGARLAAWLRLIAPGWVDRLTARAMDPGS